jgi:hypothetical protein
MRYLYCVSSAITERPDRTELGSLPRLSAGI